MPLFRPHFAYLVRSLSLVYWGKCAVCPFVGPLVRFSAMPARAGR